MKLKALKRSISEMDDEEALGLIEERRHTRREDYESDNSSSSSGGGGKTRMEKLKDNIDNLSENKKELLRKTLKSMQEANG